jgi:hypothetical protein
VPIPVIISLQESTERPDLGVQPAKDKVKEFISAMGAQAGESDFYVFASLLPDDIKALAEHRDWVRQIWMDHTTYGHLLSSTDTIKASSCWRTFDARGKGITWAVMDTGIHAEHPHFTNLNTVNAGLSRNFSSSERSMIARATARMWPGSSPAWLPRGPRENRIGPPRLWRRRVKLLSFSISPPVPREWLRTRS